MTHLPQTIGVVGAGQMGAGIAQVAAQSGCDVVLTDVTLALAEKGKAGIDKILAKQVEKGKLQEADRQALLSRIRVAEGLAGLAKVEMVIEAAFENQEQKKKLFAQLDEIVQRDAILASNTSSISLTLLGAQTRRPEKVIGMHFMNPVPLMALVEIIRSLATDEATYTTTVELAHKL